MIKNIIGIVVVVIAFITLLWLGLWQVERLKWKNNIIAQLEAEYAKDAMDHRLRFNDFNSEEIRQGHIRGSFSHNKQVLMGPKKYKEQMGYHVLVPVNLSGGGSILADLGWVEGYNREDIKIFLPRRIITLTGISRKPAWNRFTPENSPENDIWTKLDIDQIAQAKEINKIAPVIFYAKSSTPTLKKFKMLEENWFPRNKHRQYAIFWFSMAIILLVFVGIYVFKQRKRTN